MRKLLRARSLESIDLSVSVEELYHRVENRDMQEFLDDIIKRITGLPT